MPRMQPMNDPIRDKLWADVYARVKAEDKFACNPKHEADMAVRDYDARLASQEAPVTPQAEIPAAPSVGERYCNKCGYFGRAQLHDRPDGSGQCGYLARIRTQPTTVQQADQTYALKWCAAALQAVVASRGERGSISMLVSGEKKSLEEVLDIADDALKTAQTTALPGERKEQS